MSKSDAIKFQIFDLSGKMVASLKENRFDDGYRVGPINWDGTTGGGDQLKSGIYFYRLNVTTEDGKSETKAEKLIILR